MATLISMSEKRLLIDSFAQHAAAALGKQSVVCWVGNKPEQLGYEMHTNIKAEPPTRKLELRHSVYSPFNITGDSTEFPYESEDEIFNTHAIVRALKNDSVESENKHHPSEKVAIQSNLKNKIVTAYNRGSMVAQRLVWLMDKMQLDSVTQILDIGSWHLGQSIEFANIFDNAKIDAFEPVPESYQLCLHNKAQLESSKKTRIQIHNIAISNKRSQIPFYPIDPSKSSVPNVGASSMFKFIDGLNGTPFGQNLTQKEILVEAETLDNWCIANNVTAVDIMWVDVQGAELLVFEGAKNILKNTKVILTEVGLKSYYEGHTLKADIDQLLSSLGFQELKESFEWNVEQYEANTIYIRDILN
jgi:FkbM family methyltransferase